MGINCAPLVAVLFLFCCEREFMLYLSNNNQVDVVEAILTLPQDIYTQKNN